MILLGLVFSVVGLFLGLGILAAFFGKGVQLAGIITGSIGLFFLVLGLPFMVVGIVLFTRRYQRAQQMVKVLKEGNSILGKIREVQQNYRVQFNGRNPWVIDYEYQVNGQTYAGKVSTMNQPGQQLQQGKAVRVLYLATNPQVNSIYPHP